MKRLVLVPMFLMAWSAVAGELYKNEEYYQGSQEAEMQSFIEGGQRVRRAQEKIAGSNPAGRVFHEKTHGCYLGKLNLLEERPTDVNGETFVGLFNPKVQKSYDVIVRFSNGLGIHQPDKFPDVRGIAIKVIDVQNSETGQLQNVDLLMTNSPTPGGKDFMEFAEFMDFVAEYGPTWGSLRFFNAYHFRASYSLLKASGVPLISNYRVRSLATQRYWSGHPYLLGKDRAMKFNIIPVETFEFSKRQLKSLGPLAPNYLSFDLRRRLQTRDVKFKFAIQLEKEPTYTPIEDNLVEWTEKVTPSIEVAELVLEKQPGMQLVAAPGACERMRFTPGHFIPEHRPLSNMGRGRIFAYEASQRGRRSNEQEPTAKDLQFWREFGGL